MRIFIDCHNFSILQTFSFQNTKVQQKLHPNVIFGSQDEKKLCSCRLVFLFLQFIITLFMTTKENKVDYPQNFDIKLIIAADIPMEEAKRNISKALSESKTVHSFVNARSSSKGNYISYCYNVDIESKEHLEDTYAKLKGIPGLKFAL